MESSGSVEHTRRFDLPTREGEDESFASEGSLDTKRFDLLTKKAQYGGDEGGMSPGAPKGKKGTSRMDKYRQEHGSSAEQIDTRGGGTRTTRAGDKYRQELAAPAGPRARVGIVGEGSPLP